MAAEAEVDKLLLENDDFGVPYDAETNDQNPLTVDTNLFDDEAPEIPSPTFPCVNPSSIVPDLVSSAVSRCKDIRDPLAVAGVVGLQNLGNTCFMNSGLQCLLSNPQLASFFLTEFEYSDDTKHTLTGKFYRLLRKFWSGRYSLLYPSDFKKIVGIYHPQFRDHRQHDCQEFLALLLDSLQESLNVQHPSKPICGSSEDPLNDTCSQSDSSDLEIEDGNASFVPDVVVYPVSVMNSVGCSFVSNLTKTCETKETLEECGKVENIGETILSTLEKPSPDDDISLPSSFCKTKISGEEESSLEEPENEEEFMETDAAGLVLVPAVGPNDVARCRMPSIEDFCSKDTKTLNTNVLLVLENGENLATDSDKFHKPNNTSERRPTSLVESVDEDDVEPVDGQLQDLLAACDEAGLKPCKDTNLVANCREKYLDGFGDFAFVKAATLAKSCEDPMDVNVDCSSTRSKQCFRASMSSTEMDNEDEHPDINNTKRIKIDDQAEKNFRMQTKLKVNTEQNRTRASPPSADCSSAGNITVGSNVDHSMPTFSSPSVVVDNNLQVRQRQRHPVDRHQARYVRSAQKAWLEYTAQNRSVVVATFHGQFKSTVICSDCHHVSVTFEPFMYLSVPMPYALERQIRVIFVPCDNKQPVRYLLTLHRQDTVKRLRSQLVQVLDEDESCDLIIAEVLDNHIARVLEDHMSVKAVNDSDRTVYAFEMLPPPSIESQMIVEVDDCTPTVSGPDCAANNTVVTSPVPSTLTSLNRDINNDCFNASSAASAATAATGVSGWDPSVDGDVLNNRVESTSGENFSTIAAQLESNPDVNWHHNELGDNAASDAAGLTGCGDAADVAAGASLTVEDPWIFGPSTATDRMRMAWGDDDGIHASGSVVEPCGDVDGLQSLPLFDDDIPNFDPEKPADSADVESAAAAEVDGSAEEDETAEQRIADQWKSCVICLEDMEDSQLKIHAPCGCTLCHSCLETSFLQSKNCPMCMVTVNPDEDFIHLSCMGDYKPKTRMLSVPIVNRCSTSSDPESNTLRLFGHPNVLYLPSKLTGTLLYQTVDRVAPYLANYNIVLTDGQGLRCSRCLYTQHCTGCELPRDGSEINMQPGDHLAVHFTELADALADSAFRFVDHTSMQLLRSTEPLTLYDCVEAFAESELLDEHNPWFCPKCRKNQCASKTMSVWRYPDTLVVHLKRFVYHELSSTKIDNKVVFPLEGLDLSKYISGPATDELVYDLQSCVCHFGGANSGHYTAYTRHAISGEWFYSNDETVVRQTPHDADYSSVYILFYQRRGTSLNFQLPQSLSTDVDIDDDEMESFTDLKPATTVSPVVSMCDLIGPQLPEPGYVAAGDAATADEPANAADDYDFYK